MRSDILSKLPLIGSYWTGREIPASDSVCVLLRLWALLCADFGGSLFKYILSELDRYQEEGWGGGDGACRVRIFV